MIKISIKPTSIVKRKAIFVLDEDTNAKLDTLKRLYKRNRSELVEMAIDKLYQERISKDEND